MFFKKVYAIVLTLLCVVESYGQEDLFRNNYFGNSEIKKLDIKKAVIYSPRDVWHYTHHPSIVFFKDKFYAVFSNGVKGEDDPGQRILISKSTDFKKWDLPEILKEPKLANDEIPYTLTPGGIFVHQDKLTLLYTENNIGEKYARLNVAFYMISSEDGISWSQPERLNVNLFPSHRPSILKNGRWLITGNDAVYYTDDNNGLKAWKKATYNGDRKAVDAVLVEGTFLEHPNGKIYNLLRSTGKTYDGFLYQIASDDNGTTWSVPIKTKFTDNNSKSYLGVLPDGRYYHIGTPDTIHKGKRTPLVLSVSKDGFNYDKAYIVDESYHEMKYKGKWKEGQFGYPFAYVHEKYLYIIYSRNKEQLEVARIEINKIE